MPARLRAFALLASVGAVAAAALISPAIGHEGPPRHEWRKHLLAEAQKVSAAYHGGYDSRTQPPFDMPGGDLNQPSTNVGARLAPKGSHVAIATVDWASNDTDSVRCSLTVDDSIDEAAVSGGTPAAGSLTLQTAGTFSGKGGAVVRCTDDSGTLGATVVTDVEITVLEVPKLKRGRVTI